LLIVLDIFSINLFLRERVAKILACLGNEIIAICTKSIPLKSLFKGKPVLGKSKVQEAATNCMIFLATYDEVKLIATFYRSTHLKSKIYKYFLLISNS